MTDKPNLELIRSDLTRSLDDNMDKIRKIMNIPPNKDVILRELETCGFRVCLVYLEGMAGRAVVDQFILERCLQAKAEEPVEPEERADFLIRRVIAIDDAKKITGFQEMTQQILMGKSAMMIDGCPEAIAMETRGYEKRSVEKTSNESVVYGPKEGFVESIRTNITLIRRIVQSEDMVSDIFTVGTQVPTLVSVMYLKGVVNERALERVRNRIRALNIPQCPGTGYLQQLIEDHPYSLMPQMLETERPDRAASCLSDGQVIVAVDGSPYVLVAPISFWHLLHASDDSFMRWQYGTFVRLIRMLGIVLSLLVPGVYVALTMFHQHMIPMELLTSIIETRAKVPFPVLVEVLIMETAFFLLNEASTRVPSLIGPSVGLVGALILGQAAVAASIISPILIIVIALTGLGNYTVPNYGVG
ncbi:MAG: spore germination protein, partial [Clostridia bacterium]|nr:spore germination protein [Clostridia bacterium]